MADSKPQKISIGFHGGQVLTARVPVAELVQLREKLGSGGWHSFAAEDGTVSVDLDKIVYLLVDDTSPRVGFGA
jgi:hypothetical protein